MSEKIYKGACFCGAVEISARGEPEGMGYCHCDSCRSWAAAPINGFTLWKPESIEIVKGEKHIGEYHKTTRSHRKFCIRCGGHIMTDHPEMGVIDVYSAVLPELPFEPGLHVHYGESVLSVKDDLPKFYDLPSELGGSGQEFPK